jgi:hypothetical protein
MLQLLILHKNALKGLDLNNRGCKPTVRKERQINHEVVEYMGLRFSPLRGCGCEEFRFPWVYTHGYSDLATSWQMEFLFLKFKFNTGFKNLHP